MALSESVKTGLIEAVRFAGRTEIMPRFRNLPDGAVETKKHADDLVTIADKKAELVISERASNLLPNALIIGEEAVEENPSLLAKMSDADLSVIIDPIDGTAAYATGLTTFGVILAVQQEGETVFGLLYDPVMDDWIVAERGQGAYFVNANGTSRLNGTDPKPVSEMRGYASLYLFDREQQMRLAKGMMEFRRLTTLRCSCHEYRMVAQGHADFTLTGLAKPWDHGAGALVVEECGGAVFDGDGNRYNAASAKAPLWIFGFDDKACQAAVMETLLG